jgi:hypothetical protein
MMRKIAHFIGCRAGAKCLGAGVISPQLLTLGVMLACASLGAGCSNQEQDRNLNPEQVGLTPDVAPVFDDGESQLYEVKRGLQFPIVQPTAEQVASLASQVVEPYGRMPWVTNKDSKVQLTWTLSNLDDKEHVVELLIDPWNEFGRYYPGMTLTNAEEQEFQPNSSGIDHYYVLDPSSAGDSSRRHGTFTFEDMNEMAIDFATVQNMIKFPPPLPGGQQQDPDMMTDPLPVYANHAFNLINHSYNDLLVRPYIPRVIAGLTGIDFGFRTTEKATVALDIQIEIVDLGQQRVEQPGENKTLLEPTTEVVTVGSAVPTAM